MQSASKKRRHTFKELMRMFYDDRLPLNYLWNNITDAERRTFLDGVHSNVNKHFPDGQVLSKRQIKVLEKDLFIIPCVDKSTIVYHSTGYALYCCSKCIINKKSYKIMKTLTACSETCCECSICLDSLETGEKFAQLECAHKFHKNCIQKWLVNSLSCPCCRKSFEKIVDESNY